MGFYSLMVCTEMGETCNRHELKINTSHYTAIS